MTKPCSSCGNELPLNFFGKDKNRSDGLSCYCKSCNAQKRRNYYKNNKDKYKEMNKKYQEANREKLLTAKREYHSKNRERDNAASKIYSKNHLKEKSEYDKLYRIKNLEKITNYHKQYQRDNAERLNEHRRIYCRENADKVNAKKREYSQKHPDKKKEYGKRYALKHPDKIAIRTLRRQTRKRNVFAYYIAEQWESARLYFDNKCAYCGKERKLTQDHFLALSKSGEYTINNIVPSCKSCNSSKGSKNFFEWYPKQEFYSKKREQKVLKYLNYTKDGIQQLAIVI